MMDTFHATMVCEGVEPETYEDEIIDCWQHLIDTGLAWQLQGAFGRQAMALIEAGICTAYTGD